VGNGGEQWGTVRNGVEPWGTVRNGGELLRKVGER